jgi:hypothetical protein
VSVVQAQAAGEAEAEAVADGVAEGVGDGEGVGAMHSLVVEEGIQFGALQTHEPAVSVE